MASPRGSRVLGALACARGAEWPGRESVYLFAYANLLYVSFVTGSPFTLGRICGARVQEVCDATPDAKLFPWSAYAMRSAKKSHSCVCASVRP